ncbi:MAG: DUF4287 domain-containing protein [Bacteroidetes bacterium]|nr:DUF4287 domain-containing protein [Bacteroidota bacterium]
MKADYWDVTDEQVMEKTGKKLADWDSILKEFGAANKKSNDVVNYLQTEYNVPRYWARTLTTRFSKMNN